MVSSTPEEDAAWQAIVENYGTEPEFPSEPAPPPVAPPVADGPVLPAELDEVPTGLDQHEAHYVPPEPPAVSLPPGPRGVAWLGVLGVPALVILLVVLPWNVPGWLAFLLLTWFAGGFVYLVATMNRSADDGWDDGAVV